MTRFVDIDGVTLHYSLSREGPADAPALVFINSLGTDFRIWDAVVEALRREATLLTYDKRGHGLSGLGPGVGSIDDHVDDLAGLIDSLGLSPVVLCGLSVGGLIALGYTARRPAAVRALALCDTAPKIGTDQSWNDRIATVERDGLEAIADGVMQKWFTPGFHAQRSADLAGYRTMLVRQPVAGYCGTCAAIRDADYTDQARRIAVPTLCVVGDQDGSTPPDLVRAMAALIPGATFQLIEEAGHIPCVEGPDALVALLRQHIASLSARP